MTLAIPVELEGAMVYNGGVVVYDSGIPWFSLSGLVVYAPCQWFTPHPPLVV